MTGRQDLFLASTSVYRRALMERLGVPFHVEAPETDESRRPGERPAALVARLAEEKARAVGDRHTSGLFIGSDQLAVRGDEVIGKPGTVAANVEQIRAASGGWTRFLTAVCVYNRHRERAQVHVERFDVKFRRLDPVEIERYVARERALDCAGGFRAESLGCAIFEKMHGDDPAALQGLPLIRLCAMLAAEGFDVLAGAP